MRATTQKRFNMGWRSIHFLEGFICLTVVLTSAACAAKPLVTPVPAGVSQVNTIAVFPFQDNSISHSTHTTGLSQTLTDGLSEALAGSEEITLIDRTSIEKILNELSLSSQGMTEAEGRLGIGKLLGAHYLILGEYAEIAGTLRLDARIIEVQSGTVKASASKEGAVRERKGLETAFSKEMAALLFKKTGRPKHREPVSSGDFFSRGLALERENQTDQALEHYQKALVLDPENRQAREHLEALLLLTAE